MKQIWLFWRPALLFMLFMFFSHSFISSKDIDVSALPSDKVTKLTATSSKARTLRHPQSSVSFRIMARSFLLSPINFLNPTAEKVDDKAVKILFVRFIYVFLPSSLIQLLRFYLLPICSFLYFYTVFLYIRYPILRNNVSFWRNALLPSARKLVSNSIFVSCMEVFYHYTDAYILNRWYPAILATLFSSKQQEHTSFLIGTTLFNGRLTRGFGLVLFNFCLIVYLGPGFRSEFKSIIAVSVLDFLASILLSFMTQEIALTVLILGFLAVLFLGIEFNLKDIYSAWSDEISASRIYLAFLFSVCLVWPKFSCIYRRLIVPTLPEISYPESIVGSVKSSNPFTGIGPRQWLHFMYRCSVKNIVIYYGSTLLIAFLFLFVSYFKLTPAKFSGYKNQYLSSIIFSILFDLVYLLIGNVAYPSILLGPFFSFTSLRALFRGYSLMYYDSEYQFDILFQLFELLLVNIFYLEPITLQIIIASVFSAGYLILVQTRKPVQILPMLVPFLLKSVSLQVMQQGLQPWIPYSKLLRPEEAAFKQQPEQQKKETQPPFSRLGKWKIEEKKISK